MLDGGKVVCQLIFEKEYRQFCMDIDMNTAWEKLKRIESVSARTIHSYMVK